MLWLLLYVVGILYIVDEFFFHILISILTCYLKLFCEWIYAEIFNLIVVKWDLVDDIAIIKLISLVLWKRFISYQGTFPLFLIYLILSTCMPCIYIFSFLITSCYVSLILDSSGMYVVYYRIFSMLYLLNKPYYFMEAL